MVAVGGLFFREGIGEVIVRMEGRLLFKIMLECGGMNRRRLDGCFYTWLLHYG
jgi:hypothetical protein